VDIGEIGWGGTNNTKPGTVTLGMEVNFHAFFASTLNKMSC
jgi:hypothetical protein